MDDDVPRLLCGTPELPPDCVALTFDDGPGPRSAELARLLRDEGVPGTFFVLRESLERYGHVLDSLRECGHAIGLHGDRHRPFRSAEHAAAELRRCAKRAGLDPAQAVWFRPPYGMGDWPVPGFAGPVGWHAHGQDWDISYRRGHTVAACVDAIATRIAGRRGGIVLLHDYLAASEFGPAGLTEADLDLRIVEITAALIERLRKDGLRFVPLPAPDTEPQAADTAATTGGGGLLGTEDLQNLRLFRSMARAAGGALDLVMPVRVGGDGPRLFCAPPMVGMSWCYLAMLPHLDARYPLYGLQCRGLRRPEPLPTTMTEVAQDYADQIRKIQPSGPYQLLGWSLGGNYAFAIAEELERRGEQVGLLVILDSNLSPEGLAAIEKTNEPWMIYNLVLTQFGYMPALTPADADPEGRMLELIRRRPGLGLQEWPEQRIRALQRVIRNNVAVARTHQPGRVHAPLLFFSATRNPPDLDAKLAGWARLIDGPIEAIELDCDHKYMLLPDPVTRIGPALSARLARTATAITAV